MAARSCGARGGVGGLGGGGLGGDARMISCTRCGGVIDSTSTPSRRDASAGLALSDESTLERYSTDEPGGGITIERTPIEAEASSRWTASSLRLTCHGWDSRGS